MLKHWVARHWKLSMISKLIQYFNKYYHSPHVDFRMAALPRWRNLNHFDQIMSVHFSDANKYEDILKVPIFLFCKSCADHHWLDADIYVTQCPYTKRKSPWISDASLSVILSQFGHVGITRSSNWGHTWVRSSRTDSVLSSDPGETFFVGFYVNICLLY